MPSLSSFIHRIGNVAHRVETRLGRAAKPYASVPPDPPDPPDLKGGLALIRNAPLADLRKSEFIERELLPSLGLNAEKIEEQPRSLEPSLGKGFGWRIWQYPNQFSKYLVSLSGAKINSYIEIGCRFGGTFILTTEYLARFNPSFQDSIAVDLIEKSDLLREYDSLRRFEYICVNSSGHEFARIIRSRFDLALIDGDHSFECVMTDFKTMQWRAKRIAFHDIVSKACPDTVHFWLAVKEFHGMDFEISEFIDQYPDVPAGGPFLGIGVLERK
jgi:hypothetical protein